MLLEIRLFQPAAGDDETDSHLQSLKEVGALELIVLINNRLIIFVTTNY